MSNRYTDYTPKTPSRKTNEALYSSLDDYLKNIEYVNTESLKASNTESIASSKNVYNICFILSF